MSLNELECPKDEIQITELGGGQIGITGCGKKAVYVVAGNGVWVNNTATPGNEPQNLETK